jgi:cyclopropane fatty-acyl-phospholipid synthase-like methyltransferase
MTRSSEISSENPLAWSEQDSAGLVHWLRAGGQLGEWADNTLDQIQFASQVLDLSEEDVILNPGCGWGRHAIALAHYGVHVIGLDCAAGLIELARETCAQMKIQVRWVHGDLNDLELEQQVDAVIQFDGNLLEETAGPAEALYTLDQIHSILKPGKRFLFGSSTWKAAPPRHEQSQAETLENTRIYSHTFDPDSRTIQSEAIVTGRDGSQRTYQRRVWHPTAEQMADLLYQADFDIEGQLNGFNFLPYDPNRPGLVWLARRR